MTVSVAPSDETHESTTPNGPRRRYSACVGRRDEWHVKRWTSAMTAARVGNPAFRCSAITHSGKPCSQPRMAGSHLHLCRHHLKGPERDAVDNKREVRVRRALHTGRHRHRPRTAESAFRTIANRRLRRLWANVDPYFEGSTLHLEAGDEARVLAWLAEHYGIDLDAPGATCQFRDKARWTAVLALSGTIDKANADRRLAVARREMTRWQSRLASSAPSA